MPLRERVAGVVETTWFQNTVIALILINGIILGLETVPELREAHGDLLRGISRMFLMLFIVEMTLRVYVKRLSFFRNPWSVFDLAIVLLALVPTLGPFTVMRVLRVLRVLWLLSAIPSLRRVVAGVLKAFPGMASIGVLLVLLMYVSGVISTLLFQETDPVHFGDLGSSLFSLFQVMTGDSWADVIARPIMEEHPLAWIFFVAFILLSTFIVLNWFIAVAVDAFENVHLDTGYEHQADASRQRILNEIQQIQAQNAQLHTELAELRAQLRTAPQTDPDATGADSGTTVPPTDTPNPGRPGE
ncbi:ion transporter [Lipingzhangella sp. LS1_29]|uniref:Ion transporter n=1 Tax=Lipingzhangella rawalii TaxID=2055835 RepID=A0ABU2H6A5_9ACTN|nr:ion transporter [Lipingzhangella rawalii]MDS1270820.1 ion transporter [Lipingzhangella rawalii]